MSAKVLRFRVFCPACKDGLHDRCWKRLAELFDDSTHPCPCGCWDEHGEMTYGALMDMIRRHPDVVARRIRLHEAIRRGSLDLHLSRKGRRAGL